MSTRVQELFQSKIKIVILDYERGVDIKAISRKVGVSAPTVAKWLTKEGYKRKRKGRVPTAMKSRVRDLTLRGWEPIAISELLNLSISQIDEWSKPQENPILGGEKDPLKVKGQRSRKKSKIRHGKKSHTPKSGSKKSEKWPPDRHKCNKHWTPLEKSYVLELMESRIAPANIYKKTRASKNRQRRIWREAGGSGNPPNFPAPKGSGPQPFRAKSRVIQKPSDDELVELERVAEDRRRRISELKSLVADEEKAIRILESEQKKLSLERKERAERLAQARAAVEKRSKLPTHERRRVIPGSYEDEVLGLKPGSLIEPGRPGRPALPKPKSLGEYADNGRHFVVSNDWADLEDASPDELALFADFMNLKKFPTKVEASGDQPQAYFESLWPKKVEDKWNSAVEGGLTLLDKYRERKNYLKPKKMFSRGIAKYLAKAYKAYADPTVTAAQKKIEKEELSDNWARLKKIDRLILIFAMGLANADGSPTDAGIDRGRPAKALLEKEERKALRKAEQDEIKAILSGKPLAIGPGGQAPD